MEEFDIMVIMLGLVLCCHYVNEMKKRKPRRWWVRELNMSRETHGYFEVVFKQMKECDPEEFFRQTRMSRETYELLLSILNAKLTKRRTRRIVSAECRLALTLSYLSQGVPHAFLAWSFKLGKTTVRQIILETCDVIWNSLRDPYVSHPSENDFKRIAQEFETHWNLPHCVGALDGKHINIQNPPNSGSLFYNYKCSYSIVLLAACDARYCFTFVDIGAYGSQSDGGILSNSTFGKRLLSKQLPLPQPDILPNSTTTFPYFFVGDAAFPLKENLMRPYPGKRLDVPKRVMNYRLSRARVVIENTFGILAGRWRVLRNNLYCFPENAERIVLATIALHNFVKINDSTGRYCPPSYVDREDTSGNTIRGEWRHDAGDETIFTPTRVGSNNAARVAFRLRDSLRDYCMSEGAIERQKRIK